MIRYNIHDLCEIYVDPRVGPAVISNIDFQFGGFRVEPSVSIEGLCPASVGVVPFEDWGTASGREGGVRGVVDELGRLAVERRGKSIRCFVYGGNFSISVLVQALLAEGGCTQIHAAGIADERGDVTIFPAKGGVGKTAISGYLTKEHRYRLLGDDVLIVNAQGLCYGIPRPLILKEYHRTVFPEAYKQVKAIRLGLSSGNIAGFISENIPLKGIAKRLLGRSKLYLYAARGLASLSNGRPVPISKIFGVDKIAASGKVRRVVFLERTEGEIRHERNCMKSVHNKMFSIIHNEWQGSMGLLFGMGSSDLISGPTYFRQVSDVLERCLMDVDVITLNVPAGATGDRIGRYFLDKIRNS